MEIDNHILSLSMEFERQNIIINEYETQKAKNLHDRKWRKRKFQSAKKSTNRPKSESLQVLYIDLLISITLNAFIWKTIFVLYNKQSSLLQLDVWHQILVKHLITDESF